MKRKAETQLESEEHKKLPTEESNNEEPTENSVTENTEEKKEEITPSTNPSSFSFFNSPSTSFSFLQASSEQKDSSPSAFVSPFSATSSPFTFTSNFISGENPFGNFKSTSFTSSSENGESSTGFATFIPASIESSDIAPTLQQAVNVPTGEEDENHVHISKVKVFRFVSPKWRERGQGTLKVNVSRTTNKSRIVMRNDKTLQLILNVPLLKECRVKKFSDKDIQLFSVDLSEGASNPNYAPILIRLRSTSECSDLYTAIKSRIPEFGESTEEQKPKEKKTETKSEESTPVNTTSESKEETPSTLQSSDPTDF